MKLDALVFGAHPDDAEIGMGGTIALLTSKNKKVGVADLTLGEMGTRGSAAERKLESENASRILRLSARINLKLPDGKLEVKDSYKRKIVSLIRFHKPELIFAPHQNDRHPDHTAAGRLVKEAMFLSGAAKYATEYRGKEQISFRPAKLFYYMMSYPFTPAFIVDITDSFDTKMKAIKTYKTQFYNPKSKEPETFISDPKFLNFIEARSGFYGFLIRKPHGEAFYSEEALELDLINLLNK